MGVKISEQEWDTFLGMADRLGINVRALLKEDVRFHVLESAGHALGRAVAQGATERLTLAQAERLSEPQSCPTCGQLCPVVYRQRPLETVDGLIELREPVCHCPACRRDFFPSASSIGARTTELQSCRLGQDRLGQCRAQIDGQSPEDVAETGGGVSQRSRDHGTQQHDRSRVVRASGAASLGACRANPSATACRGSECGGRVDGWWSDYDASRSGTRRA